MSVARALERDAEMWVRDIHPHAPHLVAARDWVVRLTPAASEALRIAAVLHDIERAFPDPRQSWDPATAWEDPTYLRWHQDRCADIAGTWLIERGADPDFTVGVQKLIRAHEDGGWLEADVLQAACRVCVGRPSRGDATLIVEHR